ncbi:hypothetical protein ACFOWE_08905 [Planomonospora corallina]|uniref:Lipoprotein n=1 Tax=Planomonospora corallina TaxID=1806052 RepID=A0ABV8I2P7_9ACTN
MSRVRTTMPAAALVLAVLTGCGAQAQTAAQSSPSPAPDLRRQIETARADCMKRKGFRYNVHVPPPRKAGDDQRAADGGVYGAMRRIRQKYGFKIFARFVYPGDPAADRYFAPQERPNDEIKRSLSETQAVAWEEADGACRTEVVGKVLGKTVSTMEDYYEQLNRRLEQADRETDSDPRLAGLARSFGDCLKGRGYPVTSVKPTDMHEAGAKIVEKELDRLGRAKAEDPVDEVDGMEATYVPELTAGQAMPYLAKEIKVALDDLECGREFYPAFFAEWDAHRIYAEFGHGAIEWS